MSETNNNLDMNKLTDLADAKVLYDDLRGRIEDKADKVANATNGNFAGLDANGNLVDSGKKASDFLTQHQDISGKVDKEAGKGLSTNDYTNEEKLKNANNASAISDLNRAISFNTIENGYRNAFAESQFPIADSSAMTIGGYIDNTNGNAISYNGWAYSDYIPITGGEIYGIVQAVSADKTAYLEITGNVYCGFYDDLYKFTHGVIASVANKRITSQSGDKYIRFSLPAAALKNYESLMFMTYADAEIYATKTFEDVVRKEVSVKHQAENILTFDSAVLHIGEMHYHQYRYVDQIVNNDDYCWFDIVFPETGIYGVYNSDGEITCTYISSVTDSQGNYVHKENALMSDTGITSKRVGLVFHIAIPLSEFKKGLYVCKSSSAAALINARSNGIRSEFAVINADVVSKEIADISGALVFTEATGYVYCDFGSIVYKHNGNLYEYTKNDAKIDFGRLYNVAVGYDDLVWLDIDKKNHPNDATYPKTAVLNVVDHKIEFVSNGTAINDNQLILYGYENNDQSTPYGIFYDYFVSTNYKAENKIYSGLTVDMIESINEKTTEIFSGITANDDFCFAFIGDDHNTSWAENDYLRYTTRCDYTNYAVDMCDKQINFDAILNAGDSVLTSPRPQDALKVGLEIVDTSKLIYVQGNHDRNINPAVGITSQKDFYNLMYYRFRNNENYVFGDPGNASYFYVNYPEKKVRFVCLDLYNLPVEHDSEYDVHAGYRQDQMEWLVDSALRVGSDWSVIVCTHSAPTSVAYGTNSVNMAQLRTLLEAFKNGINTTITATDTIYGDGTFDINVEANFATQGQRTLICVLAGHCHWDNIVTVNGIKYVTIACGYLDSSMFKPWGAYWNGGEGRTERFMNDYSSICFDICFIDKTNRKLKMKRVGYGADREISY